MSDDRGVSGGVPAWMVTFADMMALLLTFFVMLVSFSELKSEEKYQALLDSFQQQFGYHKSQGPIMPGDLRPRNPALSKLALVARTMRTHIPLGDAKVQPPTGDKTLLKKVRPEKASGVIPLGATNESFNP